MVEKRGLGRGLSALLGEAEEIEHATDPQAGVRDIPIELIHRNPDQPRLVFSDEEIAELATSIADKGVLQPILVRPSPKKTGEYEIVAGERRWRATQKAGLRSIPALVRHLTDEFAFEIAVVENVQRANLSAMEEAKAYSSLMGRMGYTQDEVAQKVGKSRPHVANTLRLLQLPDTVQNMLITGKLSAGHARALLSAENPQQIAEMVIAKGLSVRDVEALVRGGGQPKAGTKPSRGPKDADTAALEADLEDALGMSVDVADRGGSGAVTIRYASLEQLDEICRRLTRR